MSATSVSEAGRDQLSATQRHDRAELRTAIDTLSDAELAAVTRMLERLTVELQS